MSLSQSQLIGTWSLLEHSQINEDLNGVLTYESDNKMSVHISGKFDGIEVLINYSGTYYLDKGYVIHKVEVSDNPKRIGTEQRRYIQMNGNIMTFTESASEISFKIVWKKQ